MGSIAFWELIYNTSSIRALAYYTLITFKIRTKKVVTVSCRTDESLHNEISCYNYAITIGSPFFNKQPILSIFPTVLPSTD